MSRHRLRVCLQFMPSRAHNDSLCTLGQCHLHTQINSTNSAWTSSTIMVDKYANDFMQPFSILQTTDGQVIEREGPNFNCTCTMHILRLCIKFYPVVAIFSIQLNRISIEPFDWFFFVLFRLVLWDMKLMAYTQLGRFGFYVCFCNTNSCGTWNLFFSPVNNVFFCSKLYFWWWHTP